MSNPYLDNVMDKYTPPIPNCPVDFYYKQKSDGSMSFALYDHASGLQLYSQDYPAPGTLGQPTAQPAGNPYLDATPYLQNPDPSAAQAPASGMQVFHPVPMCPIAMGYWLPTQAADGTHSIGIALIFYYTGTILCYRECSIDPQNHSFSMQQGVGPLGSCEIKLQLVYQGNTLTALKGTFTLTPAFSSVPWINVPVTIPV